MENKVPKDLGLKIGTPDEVFWNEVKTKSEGAITDNKRSIAINENILELAKAKIEGCKSTNS